MTHPINWNDHMEVGRFIVRNALLEDRAMEDAATGALGEPGEVPSVCAVNAREEMVLAGMPIASLVYEMLPGNASVKPLVAEGRRVSGGTKLAEISGSFSEILRGERLFLNLLGRLCGIATLTAGFVERCVGTGVEILDTRKTTPCLRALEKYAVRTGGGTNHRFSLADMAMFKDNHIAAAGGINGISSPVAVVRKTGIPVEIEVDGLEQLRVALKLSPDRILLDNMEPEELEEAVRIASASGIYLEASGGVTLETAGRIARTGVNGISSGGLTHSVRCSDIGFDWQGFEGRT